MSLLANKVIWSFLGNLSDIASRFFVQILIARLLGDEGLGSVAYILWLIEISLILSDLGFRTTLAKYLSDFRAKKMDAEAVILTRRMYLRYVSLMTVASLLVVYFAFHSSIIDQTSGMLLWIALLCMTRGISNLFTAQMQGEQTFELLARVRFVSSIVLLGAVSLGAMLDGVSGVLMGYAAAALVPALYLTGSVFKHRASGSPLSPEENGKVWRFAVKSWWIAILGAIAWTRMEILFLERFWGVSEVAVFSVGATLSGLAVLGPQMLSQSFMPHLTALVSACGREAAGDSYAACTRLIAFSLFPLSIGGAAIAPVLVPMLYGKNFVSAIPVVMVMFLISTYAFSSVGNSMLYAIDRPGFKIFDGILGGVLLIVLAFLLTPRWGAIGAAIARGTAQGIVLILNLWYLAVPMRFPLPFGAILRILLCATISGVSALAVVILWPAPATLLCAVPLGAIVYLLACRKLEALPPEDQSRIEAVLTAARLPFMRGVVPLLFGQDTQRERLGA